MEVPSNSLLLSADPRISPIVAGGSLEQAIGGLVQADSDAGIFTYDYCRIPFYQVVSCDERVRFGLQVLEWRANRPKEPRDTCPLDLPGIIAEGRQHWFTFQLLDREMVALANPYPFLPSHVTIASALHEPQFWRSATRAQTRDQMERVLRDLYALAAGVPEFLVIYNASREAGASLPDHRHYHLARLPPGYGLLAIQQVAARSPPAQVTPIGLQGDYPVCGARFTGPNETVVRRAADLLQNWEDVLQGAATANIIALTERNEVAVYIVLRNALFRLAQGSHGVLGSVEMAGLFILSADHEFQALRERRLGFGQIWEMLSEVRPLQAKLVLSRGDLR